MALVDLKRDKKDERPVEPMEDSPDYPWGLNLNLDQDTLDKLDLDPTDFEVGEELPLVGVVKVTSISKHDSEVGGPGSSVGLVVTKLERAASDENRAEALFGDKD